MGLSPEARLGRADRILVVGPCGAGKSRFAEVLARRRRLPLVHLDRLFWRPGWEAADAEAFQAAVEAAVAGARWVIDGTFATTLPLRLSRAELVVHLDYPRPVFMGRIVKRIATSWHRVRPSMADGCPEFLDLGFFAYAWRFRARERPRLLRMLDESGVPELRLARPAHAARALAALGAAPAGGKRRPRTR